ncbi:MAG: alanine racemase [Patescibacteria group bacterium]|nr:alanine racemase [Patescibacteria group bacterium]
MYQRQPLIDERWQKFLDQVEVIELVDRYGSPLNVILPTRLKENIESFKQIFRKFGLPPKIFFAHKVTKSLALVKQAKAAQVGIDVSSVGELEQAHQAGFSKDEIVANGPKSDPFLEACLKAKVIIIVDSLLELKRILDRNTSSGKLKVLLRVSDFNSAHVKINPQLDRFGIEFQKIDQALALIASCPGQIDLLGFSFHFNDDSFEKRVVALEMLLEKVFLLRKQGWKLKVIDIGGGFRSNYLKEKKHWVEFVEKFKQMIVSGHHRVSYDGKTYGFQIVDGTIKGSPTFPAYYTERPGAKLFEEVLSFRSPTFGETSLGRLALDLGLEIWVEPGQALVDQVGLTVMRVIDVKVKLGERVIIVEGNYTNLFADHLEMFVDPLVIKRTSPSSPFKHSYFVAGNLCLGMDLIVNHKVFLPEVSAGDLLVFPNTAAYRMDFVDASPLLQPRPRRVIWSPDELAVYPESN